MPKIRSIETVDQLKYGEICITIVGEIHDRETDCKTEDQICISEHIENRLNTPNYKMIVCLEFQPGLEPRLISRLGSSVLRNIYTQNKYNKSRASSVGIDMRTIALGRENQSLLYDHSDYAELKNTYFRTVNPNRKMTLEEKKSYIKVFLEPILTDIRSVHDNKIINESYDIMINKYNICRKLIDEMEYPTKENLDELLDRTRELWANFTDVYTINFLMSKQHNVNEMIVVVGSYHSENISKIMKKYIKKHQQISGCVDTKSLW
jgi:hypothetical protein